VLSNDEALRYWFTGLADGEGCFYINVGSRGVLVPRFCIRLRVDDRHTLELCQQILGVPASLTEPSRTGKRPGAGMCDWRISKKTDLVEAVGHFNHYPLRSKKRKDFEVWKWAVFAYVAIKPPKYRQGLMKAYKQRLQKARAYPYATPIV